MSDALGPGQSESIVNLAVALVAAQQKMGPAVKTAENPYYRSRYVDLAGAWEACRGALLENGLTVIQFTQSSARVELVTQLVHVSGEWIRGVYPIRPTPRKVRDPGDAPKDPMDDPQALGSAMTYARRYGLMAMVGLAPEDDDGNAASAVTPPKQRGDAPGNPSPRGEAADPKKISPATLSALLYLAEAKGKTQDDLLRGLTAKGLKVTSLADITEAQFARVRASLEKLPDVGASTVTPAAEAGR